MGNTSKIAVGVGEGDDQVSFFYGFIQKDMGRWSMLQITRIPELDPSLRC